MKNGEKKRGIPLIEYFTNPKIDRVIAPFSKISMMATLPSSFEIVIDPPLKHSANVTALEFKDNQLISGGADGLILVWDLSKYSPRLGFNAHDDQISKLIVSKNQIIASSWDKTISLIDLEKCLIKKLPTIFKGAVYSVEQIPEKNVLATSSEGREVRLIDKQTGDSIKVMRGHREEVTSLSVSPSGEILATGSWDGTIKLWSIKEQKMLETLTGHESEVSVVKFLTDRLLVSGSWDGKIFLWDIGEKSIRKRLEGHHNMITAIAVSKDGKFLVSASSDKTLRTWDLETLKPVAQYNGHKGRIYAIAISDENIVASGGTDKAIHLWNANSGEVIEILEGEENHVFQVFLAPTGEFVRIVYSAGKERYVDMKTLTPVEKPNVPFLHHQKVEGIKPVFLGRSGVAIRFLGKAMNNEQTSVAYLGLKTILEKQSWLKLNPSVYAEADSLYPLVKNKVLREIKEIANQLEKAMQAVSK